MRRAEMIGCIVFVLLGAHVIQQATQLSYAEKYGPGPGFMPFWLGWALVGFAALHFANIVMQPRLYPGNQPFPVGRSALRVATVYAILLVTIFLLGSLGLLIALVLMSTTLLRGVEKIRWTKSLGGALVIALALWLIFEVALSVPFPKGPLGI